MTTVPDPLLQLHRVAMDAATRFDTSPDMVFEPCGLILQMPPVEGQDNYWGTPRNVVTFASTGGDGVHFSYLKDFDSSDGKLPIVVTVPCDDDNNAVIAESFEEFLDLGYFVGWFSLGDLVYPDACRSGYFARPDRGHDGEFADRLVFLKDALQLRPVPPETERIRRLNDTYFGLLDIPESPTSHSTGRNVRPGSIPSVIDDRFRRHRTRTPAGAHSWAPAA